MPELRWHESLLILLARYVRDQPGIVERFTATPSYSSMTVD